MKIAVFARGLSHQPTGRGIAARELVAGLVRLGAGEIDVFTGEPMTISGCRVRAGRRAGPIGDAWHVLCGIGNEVREIRPDVFWSVTHLLPGGLPRALPRVVMLLDLVWRDYPETMRRGNRLLASLVEQGLHRASHIVCISAFTRERLLAYWPGLEAVSSVVHLAPNARLGETGDDRDRLDRLGIRPPYVVNVGTIEPRKNLSVLLDAMLELPEVTLVQCGPVGWNVDVLVRRAKTMPNVKLLGYVDEATLGQLYRGALAAVFPSLYEGIHLPTLDASSLGCPVVVSDIPVHREILGEAALYFPANRPGAAAARLRLLLGEPGERARRSALGRRRAAEFSWDRAAQRLAQVLRHVAGARWSPGEP